MKAIQTKYLAPTQSRGTRVKAWAEGYGSVIVPYDGFMEKAHLNAAEILIDRKNMHNWDKSALQSAQLSDGSYVFVEVDKTKETELEARLRDLVEYITSGEHYETKNPYTRPPVVEALKTLAKYYGGDWMDANKK